MNHAADQPLAATSHHIALGSPNPEALTGFHERVMGLGLRHTDRGILGEATDRRVYFVSGAPKTMAFAGFAVDEPCLTGLRCRLENAGGGYDFWQ